MLDQVPELSKTPKLENVLFFFIIFYYRKTP